MESNIYKEAKKLFTDETKPTEFVSTDSNIQKLEELNILLNTPFKISILQGAPGLGKTMLLKRFVYENSKEDIIFYPTPLLKPDELEKKINKDIFKNSKNIYENLENLPSAKFIILDEAQLYSEEMLEKIRILSDTNKLKFLLSMHTQKDSPILLKEHFLTRVYKTINIFPPDKQEFYLYIKKRLFLGNVPKLSEEFPKRLSNYIYSFTNGNYRESNKFLYTMFDIMDYFYTLYPKKFIKKPLNIKYAQMSAIELGYIDA